MVDGFIRKKVESLTLGEKLIKLRSQYRMSLAEISKATRIQVKYLEALESGNHQDLPAEVYVRGFLRSYARYLGLEEGAFLKLYDKEKHIRTHIGKVEVVPERKKIILSQAWVITPRNTAMIIMIIILGGTSFYLFREFHAFVAEPHLVVTEPDSGSVTSESSVTIKGKTDRGARVTLNDESVFVGNDGDFQETLTLQPGSNIIRIQATNRFEKTKEVMLSLESNPPVPLSSTTPLQSEKPLPIPIILSVSQKVKQIRVEVDDVVVWNGPWTIQKTESFSVGKGLKITTDNPRATLVQVGTGVPRAIDTRSDQEFTLTYTLTELTALVHNP